MIRMVQGTNDMNTLFTHPISLQELGWKHYFQQQLTNDELDNAVIARVIGHHRSGYDLCTSQHEIHMAHHHQYPPITVGDWLLVDSDYRLLRLLERTSLFQRKAPGSARQQQLIAANVDTVFIVSSLNHDFNLSRIERYLTLVRDSQSQPVIVLTKQDLADDVYALCHQVQKLDASLMVETVNALDAQSVQGLLAWCQTGQTVALLGSSGVGKSTLINTLLASDTQQTGGIREDDSKGRHTTTARSIHKMPMGALLIDTPGMRELQLAGSEQSLAHAFGDIEALSEQCRFSDCQHQTEPGCAVQQAIQRGSLDVRRLENYAKLQREQAFNTSTLAERRQKGREFNKHVRSVISQKQWLKGE